MDKKVSTSPIWDPIAEDNARQSLFWENNDRADDAGTGIENEELITVYCIGCNKTPDELDEYSPEETEENMTATEYVQTNEGTYNPSNGHFTCTPCYIDLGMPLSPGGWVAP